MGSAVLLRAGLATLGLQLCLLSPRLTCRWQENEVIAVVETDKVALDIRASHCGVVEHVLVTIGETVKERQALFSLAE